MANTAQLKQLLMQAEGTLNSALEKVVGMRGVGDNGVNDPQTVSMMTAQANEIANDGANAKALILQAVTVLQTP